MVWDSWSYGGGELGVRIRGERREARGRGGGTSRE